MTTVPIEILSSATLEIDGLVALLRDAVAGGASIGFLSDLTKDEAAAYWRKIIDDVAAASRVIWVARDPANGSIVGSVQLALEGRRNGRHRAEVQKLMVLQTWRRRGIAAALMQTLENAAQQRRITLLFLDTSDGPGGARSFYDFLGYTHVGGIPGYALDPDGTPVKNAIYYKQLLPVVAQL